MKTKVLLFAFSALAMTASAKPGNQKAYAGTEKPASVTTINASSLFNPDLSFFRTHKKGKDVSVSWGVDSSTDPAAASNGIAGFVVQRTYEDATDPYAVWSDVASISSGASKSYKVEDENVFPGYISYRIVTVTNSGERITSAISTVHIISRN